MFCSEGASTTFHTGDSDVVCPVYNMYSNTVWGKLGTIPACTMHEPDADIKPIIGQNWNKQPIICFLHH